MKTTNTLEQYKVINKDFKGETINGAIVHHKTMPLACRDITFSHLMRKFYDIEDYKNVGLFSNVYHLKVVGVK